MSPKLSHRKQNGKVTRYGCHQNAAAGNSYLKFKKDCTLSYYFRLSKWCQVLP